MADPLKKSPTDPVLVAEGVSRAGRRVTLELVVNRYEGATPHLVVSVEAANGQDARRPLYTNYPRRGQAFFDALLADVTDTQELMRVAPRCRQDEALVAGQTIEGA